VASALGTALVRPPVTLDDLLHPLQHREELRLLRAHAPSGLGRQREYDMEVRGRHFTGRGGLNDRN